MATAEKRKEVNSKSEEFEDLPEGFEVESPSGLDELPEGFEIESGDSTEESKPEVKLGFGEKIADVLTGGMITEGKQFREEATTGSMGEKAKKLAEGGKALESTVKTFGQLGQSVIAGNQTARILSKVPALQKQKVIQGLVSSAEQRLVSRGIRLSNIQRAAQRYAIEGAVAVQPFDYEDIGDRIKATTISAAISPLIGFGIEGATGFAKTISRDISKFKSSLTSEVRPTTSGKVRDPMMPTISSIKEALAETQKKASEVGASSRRQILESQGAGKNVEREIAERADILRSNVSSSVKAEQNLVKKSLEESKNQINRSIKITDRLLDAEADIASKSYQSKIGKFFGENSKIYGKELDAISETIGANGRMTRKEAFDVLQNTVKRAGKEAEIFDGEVIDEINRLIQTKYNPATNITDPTSGTIYRNMDELIPFSEFKRELSDIWGKVYKNKGRSKFDDIPAAILKSEFGELVTTLPGGESFKSLQEAYRPVISYMNKANAVIQPRQGEAFRERAFNLVKRYAMDDVTPAEKDLVEFIENGTERFAKGIGAFSGRAKQLGKNINILKEQMGKVGAQSERRILEIASEGADKISKIDVAQKGAEKLIEREANRRALLIMQEAAEEEVRLLKRTRQLQGREMTVNNLTGRMHKIKSLGNSIVKIIAGLSSGYLVLRGGSEIMNSIRRE